VIIGPALTFVGYTDSDLVEDRIADASACSRCDVATSHRPPDLRDAS